MNKKIGILGGGFGLYGYLPAFYNLGFDIFTLEKYSGFIKNRKDLEKLYDRINFISSEEELFNNVEYLNIARDPINQFKFLVSSKDYSFKHLYLEKPLAHNLKSYRQCLEILEINKQSASIFYSLSYLDWYQEIIQALLNEKNQNITVNWNVVNNNSNWKHDSLKGGGLFKYYGIHFIPMFLKSNLEIENINQAKESLKIELKNKNENKFNLNLSNGEINNFSIFKNEILLLDAPNPFIRDIIPEEPDPRIEIIEKYIIDYSTDFLNIEKKIIEFMMNFE